jgi:hypothetical protein
MLFHVLLRLHFLQLSQGQIIFHLTHEAKTLPYRNRLFKISLKSPIFQEAQPSKHRLPPLHELMLDQRDLPQINHRVL